MRTKHILLCATVALLFTAAVAQNSSGAPPTPPPPAPAPPLPTTPTSAPPPLTPPLPTSTVVTTPPSITTAVTTEPSGNTVNPTITPGSNSADPPPADTTTTTSTITDDNTTLSYAPITFDNTTLPTTTITDDNTTLPTTTINSDNTTLPTTTINSDNGTLPLSTSAADGSTSPPLSPPTDGPGPTPPPLSPPTDGPTDGPPTPTASTGSQPTSDILTVPLPQPTITVATTQAISPIPTDSVAQLPGQRMVNSTDPRIQYQGTSWTPTNSTCDSEVTSMKCQDPDSYLSYRFKAFQGGSVFLGSTRSPEAGVYVVTLDNVQTKLDGFTTSADNSCSLTWSQTNLDAGFHNLTVSFIGPSPQSPSESGSFELNTFQLVAEDPSPGPSVPLGSGGKSLLAEISCAAVFFAIVLHILSA